MDFITEFPSAGTSDLGDFLEKSGQFRVPAASTKDFLVLLDFGGLLHSIVYCYRRSSTDRGQQSATNNLQQLCGAYKVAVVKGIGMQCSRLKPMRSRIQG